MSKNEYDEAQICEANEVPPWRDDQDEYTKQRSKMKFFHVSLNIY